MWVLFAVFLSLTGATYSLCVQNIRLKPAFFMIYRGMISALLIIPLLFYFRFVPNIIFCSIAIFQGFLVSYYDLGLMKSVKKYGAEAITSILPVGIVLNFAFWCLIDHQIFIKYTEHPLQSGLIVFSLIGVTTALMGYKKASIAKKAIIDLIPIIVVGLLIDLSNKIIMNYANNSLVGYSFWRAFILSLVVGTIHFLLYIFKKEKISELIKFENLKKTWIFGLNIAAMVIMSIAMYDTPNPAYVSAIAQTSLLWIICFNQILSRLFKNQTMPMPMGKRWAFLMLVSAITLILTAN